MLQLFSFQGIFKQHCPITHYYNYNVVRTMPEGTAVSRRHFLKLIGYFGIVSLGGIGSFVELYKKRGSFPPLVSPSASSGSSSVYPLQSAFAQTGGGGTWA